MYEAFYNLNGNPFRLTPDPRFCFSHSGYQRAREYLVYALRLGEGFIVITGQPGTGKTTLAETFLKELEVSKVVAARIVAPNLGATGLLQSVAFAFAIPAEKIGRATLRSLIEQFFTRQVRGGKRVLLIIDEAQGLPHPALEELRLLADLQSGTQPLLQIFLIGQCSLRDMLQVPDMNHFQQRVIATYHLSPLALAETSAYMEYRLIQAGWKGDPEFTGEAVLFIYQYTHGIPRHINKLCNRLLLIGYGKEKHRIDQQDVEEISTELQLEKLAPISGNEPDRADLSGGPLDAGLLDNRLLLDSLALRSEDVASEKLGMAVEAEPEPYAEPEACLYSGETADWPVEVASAACRPELPEHQPASSLSMAEKAGAALSRCTLLVKHSLGGIDRLPLKPALMAVALVITFVSSATLTLFHMVRPVTDGVAITNPADPANPVPVPESRDTRIPELLGRARLSQERDRLQIPPGDSAYHYYSKVLELDPGNRTALDGITQVADRYAELASRANRQQDSDKARLYLERGLQVQPDNAKLLALRTAMDPPPASGAEMIKRWIVASKMQLESLFLQIKDFLKSIADTAR